VSEYEINYQGKRAYTVSIGISRRQGGARGSVLRRSVRCAGVACAVGETWAV